jgi:hypothetical protein
MIRFRLLFPLAFLCLCSAQAIAQINVKLQMERKSFLSGESVPVAVTITNNSGQDIVFQGANRLSWIDFTVSSLHGTALTPAGQPAFGSVKIPLGQAMTRTVDLARLFPIQAMGNYSVYCVVRLPGQTTEGFISNRLLFNIETARPYWAQKVGAPGKSGQTLEYRVLNFTGDKKSLLYAQLVNTRTGNPIQTHSLGEVLMFRKPTVTLDKRQVMHVLYLIGPTLWAHAKMGPDGKLLGRDLHKRGASSDPLLVTLPNGTVQVGGGIPYDPKAEATARQRVRKANERPAYIYQ